MTIETIASVRPNSKLKVSPYIERQFPQYMRDSDSRLIDLLKEYYRWAEQELVPGSIDYLKINAGGSNYSSPTVSIIDPSVSNKDSGELATATLTVADGVITGITLNTRGKFYRNVSVVVDDPTGTGADIEAFIVKGFFQNRIASFERLLDSDFSDINTLDILKRELLDTLRAPFSEPTEENVEAVRLILKLAKRFYQTKGIEEAYKFLFRAIYNSDAEIKYPYPKLPYTGSEGDFVIVKYLSRVDVNSLEKDGVQDEDSWVEKAVGKIITGTSSGATAKINQITRYTISPFNLVEISIDPISGVFEEEEEFSFIDVEIDGVHTYTADFLNVVEEYTISDGGEDYTPGQIFPVVSYGGGTTSFKVAVDQVGDDGDVLSLRLLDYGANFNSAPVISTEINGASPNASISFTIGPVFRRTIRLTEDNVFGNDVNDLLREFTYIIRSEVGVDEWLPLVKRAIHPAGMNVIGEIGIDSVVAAGLYSLQTSDGSGNLVDTYPEGVNHITSSGKKLFRETRIIIEANTLKIDPAFWDYTFDSHYPDGIGNDPPLWEDQPISVVRSSDTVVSVASENDDGEAGAIILLSDVEALFLTNHLGDQLIDHNGDNLVYFT